MAQVHENNSQQGRLYNEASRLPENEKLKKNRKTKKIISGMEVKVKNDSDQTIRRQDGWP
jgi:hypothetical protein